MTGEKSELWVNHLDGDLTILNTETYCLKLGDFMDLDKIYKI